VDADGSDADAADHPVQVFPEDVMGRGGGQNGRKGYSGQCEDGI